MNLILASLVALLMFFEVKNVESNIEIDLIESFLEKENSKYIVTVYTCWPIEKRFSLMKTLQKNNFLFSVTDITNGIILDNVNIKFKHLFVLDIDCNNSISVLQQANTKKLYSALQTWLIISKDSNIEKEIQEKFNHFDMYVDSNVHLAQKVENNFVIREIYKIDVEYLLSDIGLWTKEEKFRKFRKRVLAAERRNLRKRNLTASIVVTDNDTLKHLDDYRNVHIDSITKVNYILTNQLIEYVNGSVKMYPVDTWGYYNPETKMFNGMIGDMLKNVCEIGGTPLFMTNQRVEFIDYLSITSPTRIRFTFRQPPLSYEQNIFTLPFTKALWISSFLLVLLLILLLYSAVLWEWKVYDLERASNILKNSFMDCAMLIFSAAVQQGSSAEPRSAAGKFIMILVLISLMFLFVSYSANIISLLQAPSSNIRTLEDLLHSKMKLGVEDTTYNRYYFKMATDFVRKAIYDKKIVPIGEKPHFMSLDEGVNIMREGYFAFHMEIGRGYKVVADTFYEDEKCGIQEIDFLAEFDPYYSIKKNSTFKEIFKLGMGKMRENGLHNRQISRFYTSKPKCLSSGASFTSVGITELQPAFIFFAVGLLLSLLLLILEISLSKKAKNVKFYSFSQYK